MSSIIKTSKIRMYTKGQTILYPDDRQPYLYIIKNGAVLMHDIDRNGNRKALHIFRQPTLFPMVSFLEKDVSSSWFYTTLIDTEVYVIPYESFRERLQHKDAHMAFTTILQQALTEVHELLLHITDHTKTDSMEKIISMLLFLLAHHTKATTKPWRTVTFPVPHQLIADLTGLTRETVTLSMKELSSKKLVRYPTKGILELYYPNLSKQSHS